MKQIITELNATDLKIEYSLKEGKAEIVICDEAIKNKADLIVLRASHKFSLSKLFLGFMASHVIENANIPVLVVPNSK